MLIYCFEIHTDNSQQFPPLTQPQARVPPSLSPLILIQYTYRFGGLEVACWPLVPKFAGSNPAVALGLLRAKKSSARLPSEGK